MINIRSLCFSAVSMVVLAACANTKPAQNSTVANNSVSALSPAITSSANLALVENPLHGDLFASAHTGISIYDLSDGRSLFEYQADKYFLPASNTKLFTLYAALKYLPDSLPGIRYDNSGDSLFIYPTGDPSFLHPEFRKNPVVDFLKKGRKPIVMVTSAWNDQALGKGWSWDDYNDDYMAERSAFPVYGNVIRWYQVSQKNTQPEVPDSMQTFVFSEPEVNWKVRFNDDRFNQIFAVKRKKDENVFQISQGKELKSEVDIPFVTNGVASALELLKDTVGKQITERMESRPAVLSVIFSQPRDTLLQKMMYR
ncbi:MAG: D-alanyl-D-alanine carboxypeptidase, partial [Chitinophagaceae bacterium]